MKAIKEKDVELKLSENEKTKRFTTETFFSDNYYKLPKFLFEMEPYKNSLSNNAKILYTLLKDRFYLSLKNKWIDENGEVYLNYSRKEVQEIMNFGSNRTAIKIFNELKEMELIEEERLGLNKTNKIYLKHPKI